MTNLSVDNRRGILQLIYKRWAECHDTLQAVKRETKDGSPDWEKFHEYRLEVAQAEEWEWHQILDTYKLENRDTL